MAYDGSVTAQQAEAARRTKLSVPQKRRIPEMLGMIEKLKASKKYHIFNVGPWAHVVPTGSTGTFYIPACPPDKKYVEMTKPIDAIMDELIVKSEAEMDRLMQDGREFALEIIGEGRGRNPAYSLRHSGVFLSEGDEPTAEELHQATLMLHASCSEIISDIRTLYSTDRKLFSRVVNPKIHYEAARVLNLQNEVWMVDHSPSAQVKCKLCGAMSEPDVAMCPNGHVINPELYAEYMSEQETLVAEATERAASRPKNTAKGAKGR